MTIKINRRTLLQALIAAGASYVLPAKATKAQVDKVWAEAQVTPWFFDVNDHGTLVDADIPEPQVWADVFVITTSETNDIQSLIREIQACPPLSSYMDQALDNEIESLEEELDEDELETSKEQKALLKKIEALKAFRDENEEPWIDWIELEGKRGIAKFNELIDDWLLDPIDWLQADHFPVRSGPQGVALGFFEDQEYALLDALGVVIVDGEHPGSSYYAAELRNGIEEANATAERLGLPFRFKKESPKIETPPTWEPTALERMICESGDPEELRKIHEKISAMTEQDYAASLPRELNESVKLFIFNLPKIRTMWEAADLQKRSGAISRNVARFVYIKGRHPDSAELRQIWSAT